MIINIQLQEWVLEKRVVGAIELDAITSLTAQVSSLTNMIKTLKRLVVVQEMKEVGLTCVYCGEDHVFDEFTSNPASLCYMGNFNRKDNPYSNTYNPIWKQHPSFS
ncbi:hypothetical protein EPI10_028052 [Gossypium australe]|uniref:Uncharacterized protein n=1 Tax=Gossypium australe TaxID=47621 RepID=A0A5B6UXN1_9ROSI|nr:hypothetical protein EPI10_028052 [Gossypium australe]